MNVVPSVEVAGIAAWPSTDGEPVFAEPWEGRAFGLAFDVVQRAGLGWAAFRDLLIAELEAEPLRPYYESWVLALERLVVERIDVTPADLNHARAEAAAYHYAEGGLDIEVVPFRITTDACAAIDRILNHHGMSPWAVDRAAVAHAELHRTGQRQGLRTFAATGTSTTDLAVRDSCWRDLLAVVVATGS